MTTPWTIEGTPWNIGDIVTCKRPEPAYGSGYGGNPVSNLMPGTPATVENIVSPVTGRRRYLVIVDYDDNGTTRRAALHADNIKRL